MRSHVNGFQFLNSNTLSAFSFPIIRIWDTICIVRLSLNLGHLITNIVNKATYLSSDVLSKDQSYLLTTNTTYVFKPALTSISESIIKVSTLLMSVNHFKSILRSGVARLLALIQGSILNIEPCILRQISGCWYQLQGYHRSSSSQHGITSYQFYISSLSGIVQSGFRQDCSDQNLVIVHPSHSWALLQGEREGAPQMGMMFKQSKINVYIRCPY